MVYAPRQGNDRLLLGLKGSLNDTSSTCCGNAPCRLVTRKRGGAAIQIEQIEVVLAVGRGHDVDAAVVALGGYPLSPRCN